MSVRNINAREKRAYLVPLSTESPTWNMRVRLCDDDIISENIPIICWEARKYRIKCKIWYTHFSFIFICFSFSFHLQSISQGRIVNQHTFPVSDIIFFRGCLKSLHFQGLKATHFWWNSSGEGVSSKKASRCRERCTSVGTSCPLQVSSTRPWEHKSKPN